MANRRARTRPLLVVPFDTEVDPVTSGVRERIDEPARIGKLVDAILRHGPRGVLRHTGGALPVRGGRRVSGSDLIEWDVPSSELTAPLFIDLAGWSALYRLHFRGGTRVDGHLHTCLPQRIDRIHRRARRRQHVQRRLDVQFVHPATSEPCTGAVIDISHTGLAIRSRCSAPLSVGVLIPDLEIAGPHGHRLRLDCEVRHALAGDASAIYGLQVLGTTTGEAAWVELVDDELHPGTTASASWAEAVWQLYGESGYFNLSGKVAADFARLGRAFVSAQRSLNRAPAIGTTVVWPRQNQRGAVAAMSMLHPYRHTWFAQQLAAVLHDDWAGADTREVLRAVVTRAYEHVQRDPQVRWVGALLQVKPVWSRKAYEGVVSRHVASGDACVVRCRALEMSCADDAPPLAGASGSVAQASAEELTLVAQAIAAQRPASYCDALDLCESRLLLPDVRGLWSGHRLERDRAVLVAHKDGQPQAAAVIETGADGLHVFGLLDLVRLYPLAAGGEACFPALLQAARPWFAERGKDRCVCLLEEGLTLPASLSPSMADLGLADLMLLHARHIPELLEELYALTAPRPALRRRASSGAF